MRQTKKEIMNGVEDVINSYVVAPNTVEYFKSDGTRCIRFHNTDILTFTPNGRTVRLDSGNWLTHTTKRRFNRFLLWNVEVKQRQGIWYLQFDDQEYIFKDGMRIKNNKIFGAEKSSRIKEVEKRKKQIKEYVDMYMEELLAGRLSMPSTGDCWYCAIFAQNGHKPNTEHLVSHFKERYFVPSLMLRAIEAYPVSSNTKYVLSSLFHGKSSDITCNRENRELLKALYRYICKQFDIAT